MSFNETPQTISVGSRDWLGASKDMEIRGYLPPEGTVEVTAELLEYVTQFTVTSYEIPVPANRDYESALLTERLNDAYRDDELEPEEREFLDLTREHFSRLDDR